MQLNNIPDEKETVMDSKLSMSKEWNVVTGKKKKNLALGYNHRCL